MTIQVGEREGQQSGGGRQGVVAAATAVVTGTGLAACAFAGSYTTVSGLAARHGIGLHWLAPVEIDGGMLGVIVLDLALTWAKRTMWWLRLAARTFAVGTVAANAAAGWPSPIGAGLRCAAPLLLVFITEAGRSALLHAAQEDDRKEKDADRKRQRALRIPRVRWVLDPAGTWSMWRRMKLWGETSYTVALDLEIERQAAISALADLYGEDQWKAKAPRDLVLMLRSGVKLPVAFERVRRLTADGGQLAGVGQSDRRLSGMTGDGADVGGRHPAAMTGGARQPARDGHGKGAGSDGRQTGRQADSRNKQRARELVKRKPELLQEGMGARIAEELGVSERTGQRLRNELAAEAQASEGSGPRAEW